MARVLHSWTCKEVIAGLLLSVGGYAVALYWADSYLQGCASVPAMALVYMWMMLLVVWAWRAKGAVEGGKEEFLRRDSLPVWEAISTPRSSAGSAVRGRAVMEELARPPAWTYERLRKVLIASATYDEDIPGSCAPETVDLGRLAFHVQDLAAKAALDGNEWSRVFLVDVGKQALLQGKTTRGDRRTVLPDWSGAPGREYMQRRSFCIHTHPMATELVLQGFSDGDYKGLLVDRQQRAVIMVCGDSVMLVLQTSTTPRVSSLKGVEQRLDTIVREARRGARTPGSSAWVVDFNKEVCLQFGLCLYIGGVDGRMKRVRVV